MPLYSIHMRHCMTWQYSAPVLTASPRQDEQFHRLSAASEGPGHDDGRKPLRDSPHAKPNQEEPGWNGRRWPGQCLVRSPNTASMSSAVSRASSHPAGKDHPENQQESASLQLFGRSAARRRPVHACGADLSGVTPTAPKRVHRTSIAPDAEMSAFLGLHPCGRPRRSLRRGLAFGPALFHPDLCGGSHHFLHRFRVTGTLIHDCWASYFSYDTCRHGLCGSHLLRELAFIIESNGYRWARLMKKLLCEACHRVNTSETKTLSEAEYRAIRKRYRTILTQCPKSPNARKASADASQSPMPTTCTSGSKNTKTPCCASYTTPMSALRTMRQKGASGWQRSR